MCHRRRSFRFVSALHDFQVSFPLEEKTKKANHEKSFEALALFFGCRCCELYVSMNEWSGGNGCI